MKQYGVGLGMMRSRVNPAESRRARYSASVRSRPVSIASMVMSMTLAGWGSSPGGMTDSTITRRAPGLADLAIVARMRWQDSSFQSCRM